MMCILIARVWAMAVSFWACSEMKCSHSSLVTLCYYNNTHSTTHELKIKTHTHITHAHAFSAEPSFFYDVIHEKKKF